MAAAPVEIPAVVPGELAWAHPVVAEWFVRKFGTPTEPQVEGWPGILEGHATLISAPTGSGKTLAAFLVCIDTLIRRACSGSLPETTEVVYVSPLKALSNDVQKNLDGPLREIQQLCLERGYMCAPIRTGVRTGDTLPQERRKMLKSPPHILVTTPESLYILLTSEKSRRNLESVRTVIVDEIHAMADDKRGSHLALTLERLDALVCGENAHSAGAMLRGLSTPPQRIGLSATQNPIALVGEFLVGTRPAPKIVEVSTRRALDLAVEVPHGSELSSITTIAMWDELYDRVAELAKEHTSTLVFVNTRAMVERLAFQLSERMGAENVGAHHGSLSRQLRLEAEQRLKAGQTRVLVATASLELGIDIGDVDLVCQVNTCRAIAVATQRVGRAGHWRGAVPKGRLFATTRDDLMECAALVREMKRGALDRLELPDEPLDVLMQQMVAMCAAEPWSEDALFRTVTRSHPYRGLRREVFDELVALLSEGIASQRGRYGAYLLRDRVHGTVQARRGARTTAISNGGTIPDTNLFQVVLMPEEVTVATLGEHFAVDSSPGDVIQLGNASWRIQKIETAGRVLVEDAKGAPPSVPFWDGEAPQRTAELSRSVCELREQIAARTMDVHPGHVSQAVPEVAECAAWLREECGVCDAGAEQLIAYVAAGRAVLGCVPTTERIVAERFFDEGGGMQLILHAPFGGRINKAWGLALRKRFCRGFNFELQAAATDNGINISLAEQHSFPLADVFEFLTEATAKELLEQASLAAPVFKTRWRWAAGRALQLLRMQMGRKVPPQVQRTRSDDLLASVFPQAAACFENIEGDIEIPDHALVREVMKDVLGEAMDLAGLQRVLRGMADGSIQCVAVDTVTPSAFSHGLIHAMPYAYLDEADAEERRARAVSLRRRLPDSVLGGNGRLDARAIAQVRAEAWPDIRDEHEMHDLLLQLSVLPESFLLRDGARDWAEFLARLRERGRAVRAEVADDAGEAVPVWIAVECVARAELIYGAERVLCGEDVRRMDAPPEIREDALLKMLQGWTGLLGPCTAVSLGELLHTAAGDNAQALLRMEMAGTHLRGCFEHGATDDALHVEWCERRLLQRIHQRTLATLRKQIEPVSPAAHMRWLLRWQRVAAQQQTAGEQGLLEALRGLSGFEAPAIAWEREILPARVAGYDPRWLDRLCLSGQVGWGRFSPHPALTEERAAHTEPRAIVPTSVAPITLFVREECEWMDLLPELNFHDAEPCLSADARTVHAGLEQGGAQFLPDMVRRTKLSRGAVERALWELAAAGLATADGFDNLRVLIDPVRRALDQHPRISSGGKKLQALGRWCLLRCGAAQLSAHERDAAVASACRMLLRRYGVLFRELPARETTAPRWRELLGVLRRMEARGEVRGGRFVTGLSGEQFALPEAVDGLRAERSRSGSDAVVMVSATDPLNLAGITQPGERVPAVPGRKLRCAGGVFQTDEAAATAAVVPVEISAQTPQQAWLM